MLSVVIPTLNAGPELPALIATLKTVADEVVVCDGGSTDDTRNVALHAGAVVIHTEQGRGTQLAAGAEAARGDWLFFLHADSRLGQSWQTVLRDFLADPLNQYWAAYFSLRFDDDSKWARRLERIVAWRSRRLGLPYGDQGLVINRTLYDQAGGYPPIQIMEDVALVRAVGRRWLRVLDAQIITSAARYRKAGWRRRSLRNLFCLGLYFLGVSPRRIARIYNG